MRLSRLELRNIGPHSELELDFGPGIVGFTGPNGSGKSTVLDAICFAITGESRQPGSAVDNVTWGSTSGVIRLFFTHGDTQYSIERRLGRRAGVLMQWGTERLVKAVEIREFLETLLGATNQALLDNIFVPQKKIEEIFTMRRGERLQEIQRTVGLIRAAQAYDALGDELSSMQVTVGLEEQIAAAKGGLDNATVEEVATREQVSRIDSEINDLLWARNLLLKVDELRRASAAIRNAEEEIAAARQELQEADTRSAQAQADLHVAKNMEEQVRPAAESAKQSLLRYETDKRAYAKAVAVHAEFERVGKELQAFGERPDHGVLLELEKKLAELQSGIVYRRDQLSGAAPRPRMVEETTLQERLDAALRERKEPRPEASEEEVRLSCRCQKLQHDLKIFASGSCPTCGTASKCPNCGHRLYEFDEVAAKIELDASTKKLSSMREERVENARRREEDLDREIKVIRERLKELDAIATDVMRKSLAKLQEQSKLTAQEAEKLKKRFREWDELFTKQSTMREQLPDIGSEPEPVDMDALRRSIDRHEIVRGRILELQTALKVCGQQKRGAQERLERATAARAQFSGADDQQISAEVEADARRQVALLLTREAARKQLLDTLTTCEVRREQYDVLMKRLLQQQREESLKREWTKRCRRVRDLLHVREFPTLIMRECARRLNERIAHYQRMWEAPFSLRLNEELDFEAELQEGFPVPAARLSGGQSIVGALSFRLAMADTFARQVGLLVLDEPTNHLDQQNVEQLQRLLLRLKELSGATGRQVFIVTHVEALVGFFDQAFSFQRRST